jgi:hypothetical protein
MASEDEGWVSRDSGKQRKPAKDGEDDSIELDSKEYEEWRKGTDEDSYMSDPKYFGGTTSDSTPVSSSGDSGDNSSSDRNIILVAVVVVLLLIGSGLLGIYLYVQGSEDVASWPTVEGMVLETYYEDGDDCADENDDGYYDDDECTFYCEIKVRYNFTVDNRVYSNTELIEHSDDAKGTGIQDFCQEELEGRYAVNGTVTVYYNPDDPSENFIVNEPSSWIAILFCALPVIIMIIILAIFSQIRSGNFEPGRRIGWGRFGGRFGGAFGRMRSRRGRTPVRRTRTTRTRSRRK